MTRILAIAGGQILVSTLLAHAAEADKPDILVLMPDQWRGDCLSALGHPVVRTPNLDALAKEGALFRRAYSTVPSCIPARFALLTGQFPQTSGVVGFKAKKITGPTLPSLLRDAGYATVLVGRNMHQVAASELGYQQQLLGSTYVADDDYDKCLQAAAPETGGIRKLVADLGLTFNGWRAAPWPQADDLHPTAWIVREARRIVAETPPGQALFLTASFYAPHPPLMPPKRDFDALLAQDLPSLPPRGDWVDWQALPDAAQVKGDAHEVRLEGDTLRRAQAGYFGLIHQLDRELAPLIDAFRARSRAAGRPWVVLFTTDHGEMLGDHGYFRKCEPFEGSANIPFIITGSPELGFQRGLRSSRPVCLEDVLPTLVELAGARRPGAVDGVSLVPILRGEEGTVREWLHFEHAPCYSQTQAFHALTDGRYKYIWRPSNGAEHLFDLEADPREEHDLCRDDSRRDLVTSWRMRLVERLVKRPEGFSDGQRLIPGRSYPPLMTERKDPDGTQRTKVRRPQLQIINGSAQTVDIFWLPPDGPRRPSGTVAPGGEQLISTTIGHRFLVVGREDGAEATVTSVVSVQAFRFQPAAKDAPSHTTTPPSKIADGEVTAPPAELGVPPFYTKFISARGYPIVASARVNDYALKEAAFLVNQLLAHRDDVREAMIASGSRMCILAYNEFTTDLPEFAPRGAVKGFEQFSAKDYWDARARGTGGSETDPYCSCAEENLLAYPGDPFAAECILIHEFAHNMHLRGLVNVDPTFDARLRETYDRAMRVGLWKGKYASVNHHEYFAEGVQSWFDNNRENDHDHNHVNTRAELQEYDPDLAAMCREVFGETKLVYTKPATRITGHLAGYDPGQVPTFVWPERLKAAQAEIQRQAKARSRASKTEP